MVSTEDAPKLGTASRLAQFRVSLALAMGLTPRVAAVLRVWGSWICWTTEQ
ncbi:MAG: hypothetical protein K0U93_24145 [Gammaproteobacteria bacterium]|nr:hypothetical protein [Gammaproteobacteria bacterium]